MGMASEACPVETWRRDGLPIEPPASVTDSDQVSPETLIWFSAMFSWTAGSASFRTAAKVRRDEQNRRWAALIRR